MGRGIRRQAPALVVACIALVAALSGSVYAAKKGKINGKAVKVKSLPGNRLTMSSVPGNRLKPGTIPADRLVPGTISAVQIDPATLGQVASAVHAETASHADSADSAHDAQTALNAVNALDATKINGHSAGCELPNRFFGGACWQSGSSEAAVTAPAAALSCATQGGELPDALALAAFSQQPGIALAAGDEWTNDITNVSGPGLHAVVTVSAAGVISSDLSTNTRKYRCVIPLVS